MGGLDTVVNNAGISQRSPLLEYTAEEFAKVMDLNVVAVFNGHQAAAKDAEGLLGKGKVTLRRIDQLEG